jgi:hypothetical protein
MFSVIFEVLPRKENWDDYLENAKMLRPELEQDEKSLVRWRTRMRHHEVQQKGRDEILADYHLRVGQITEDNRVPDGYSLVEQRLDETEAGEGTVADLDQPDATHRVDGNDKPG